MNLLVGTVRDTVTWLRDPSHWRGESGIVHLAWQHLLLTVAAVLLACLIALPVALWLGHVGRGGALAVNVSNVGRAVPTFAVLTLFAVSPLGMGYWPNVLALTLFAIPPILTNAYVGMREVDRSTVEAARGVGMSEWQVLQHVELPLAARLIMTGVRLAAVQVVATASLAALVAGGGLGRIVTAGFGNQDQPQVVAGAVLLGAFALVVEVLLGLVERSVDPLRRARRGRRAPAGMAEVVAP